MIRLPKILTIEPRHAEGATLAIEAMNVTVEVVGEESHEFDVDDETYADLVSKVDLSPHEVSVMVDGRPVPEDQPVEAEHVKILRLIKGG